MIRKLFQSFRKLFTLPFKVDDLGNTIHSMEARIEQLDELKILTGRMLAQQNQSRTEVILENIQEAEFKVFSQFGDDGIIQFLVDYLDIDEEIFVEFGVSNYEEANTRFLLLNNNWKGLIMDGSEVNMKHVESQGLYWRHDLTALHTFVTRENINDNITSNGISGQIGLLHIDLDGNDYWIWKAIDCIDPIIVIMEYNSVFGPDKPWTVAYDAEFQRSNHHYTYLYWGSSLQSLCDLAEEKGYAFIGCNSNGNNAFFVRKDEMKGLKALSCREGYVASKFRESRNESGQLSYLSGEDRLKALSGMEIYNTRTTQTEKI